jgi:Ethanolamine utilization protein EutJ (predicted chaperonin)
MVGITGKVYVGATTVTAPTTATSTLAVGFTELGYVSSDGVEFSVDKKSNDIRAWQNSDLVRSIVTEGTLTYSFNLLETSLATLQAYFGASLTSGKVAVSPTATGGKQSFVIDVVDGTKNIRHYVPAGEILSVEAQKIQNGEAISYGITITAYVTNGRAADIWYSEFAS